MANQALASNGVTHTTVELGPMNTLMASDRTLMAWVRTSLSFYSFGFALYKILADFQKSGNATLGDDAPKFYGLILILTGTIAMVMGTIEFCVVLGQLRRIQNIRLARASFVIALWMSAAGIFLAASIIARIF